MTQNTATLFAAIALLLCSCHTFEPGPPRRRPNVVLMMADDLASNDLSCYGGRNVRTPRLDALAREGLLLTDYYAGSSVCTPSRMALLAGAYPARLGWRRGVLGYGFAPGTGMSPRVHTIAEAFRDAGYHTAMAGKWHLGTGDMGPASQGFASSYYIPMSNNQNRDMYRDGAQVAADWDNRLLSEAFAREAVRVIEEEREAPFFLYLPWSAPHFPAEPHPDWAGRSGDDNAGRYRDVVEELDARVGEVLDALARSGKADETIVVFTSDNGRQRGQGGRSPDPLYRGQKWQSLEGGTRVPCIVRTPDAPAPGVRRQLVTAVDLFPTLAAACGVAVDGPAGSQRLDGVDLYDALCAGGDSAGRAELLYWHGQGAATAIRVGDWKLRFHAGAENPKDPPLAAAPELYDLRVDVREQRDVAAEHPGLVEDMLARARALLADVYADPLPLGARSGAPAAAAPVRARDVWGPWVDAASR